MEDKKTEKIYNHHSIKKTYCCNCGKYGHYFNNCIEPKTSNGVICFKVENVKNDVINNIFFDLLKKTDTTVAIKSKSGINILSEDNLSFFTKYQNNIKFLLVQRKYSLGYIGFIKAKWSANNKEELLALFEQMTQGEIDGILREIKTPEKLWHSFWNEPEKITNFKKLSIFKDKFDKLVSMKSWNLEFYCSCFCFKNNRPEWGFPKGHRDPGESNKDCAVREFEEETGVKKIQNKDITVLERIYEIKEDIVGTDDEDYRHIYFIAFADYDTKVAHTPDKLISHRGEIGDIGWFNFFEAISLLNKSHEEKKNILSQIYFFVMNRILKNKKIIETL